MEGADVRNQKERAYDSYLAASARVGERDAMERLARRWHPKLMAHAYRLTGERDLAADVTQDAWMAIMKGIHGLNDTDAFAAWAFRIVTHRVARVIRHRQRQRAGDAALSREPTPESDPGRAGETSSDVQRVRSAMEKLPRDQRATLGLFYLEGLRVAEIAAALNTAPGTVKTRLMHARRKVRDYLEGETP